MKHIMAFLGLAILTAGTISVKAQDIIIKTKTGNEFTRPISTVASLTFINSNLLMNYFSGAPESFNLSDIRAIYLNSVLTSTENTDERTGTGILSFYPNPADNRIYLLNLPEGISSVRICTIDGKAIYNGKIHSETGWIDISRLVKGLYLLCINDMVFKFVKL